MKKVFCLILLFGCLEGHAYSPLSCLNQNPKQCQTLLGYAQYAAKGCLYEDNDTSKCKSMALSSFCLVVRKKGTPLEALCSEIANKVTLKGKRGKTSKITSQDKADLIFILKLVRSNQISSHSKVLREIYGKSSSNLVKALCYEALEGHVGTN